MNTNISKIHANKGYEMSPEEDPFSILDDVEAGEQNNHREVIGDQNRDAIFRNKGKLERLKSESINKTPDEATRKKMEAGWKKVEERLEQKEKKILERFVEQQEYINRIRKQLSDIPKPEMLGNSFVQRHHQRLMPYFIEVIEFIDNANAKYDQQVYSNDGFPTKYNIKVKGAPPVLPVSAIEGMGDRQYAALKKFQEHWEKVTLGLKLNLVKQVNQQERTTTTIINNGIGMAISGTSLAGLLGGSSGGGGFHSTPVSGGFGSAPYTGYQAMG